MHYQKEIASISAQISEYERQIASVNNEKKYDVLKELYAYFKNAVYEAQKAGVLLFDLKQISFAIEMMTKSLPNETIIPIKPYDFNKEIKTNELDITSVLDILVYEERYRLLNMAQTLGYNSLDDYDPINDCRMSALYIYNMAKNMGLNAKIKIIEPGYLFESTLYGGGCKHVVVIISYKAKNYLVDATYKQYFMRKRCILEKIGSLYLPNPNPGTFMVMDKSRRKTAEKILNDGWIELTMENFKNYFDGFTMFYRNGSYYEHTEDFSYEPSYSFLDYFRFLNGLDNQALHEGYQNLGYQSTALNNPNMSFNKR